MLGGIQNPGLAGGPGGSALAGGYKNALGNLSNSMKMLRGSDSSQLMGAQQELQQNQGKVQQGLINSGLGNTTVAQTMQQAPLQTYNNQVAGINNTMNKELAGVQGQAAGLDATGGNQMAQLLMQMQQMQAAQKAESDKYAASRVTGPMPAGHF